MPSSGRRAKKERRHYSTLYAIAALYLMAANIISGVLVIVSVALALTGHTAAALSNLLTVPFAWLGLYALGHVLIALADIATNTLETKLILQKAHNADSPELEANPE